MSLLHGKYSAPQVMSMRRVPEQKTLASFVAAQSNQIFVLDDTSLGGDQAQASLGFMHQEGQGVPQNDAEVIPLSDISGHRNYFLKDFEAASEIAYTIEAANQQDLEFGISASKKADRLSCVVSDGSEKLKAGLPAGYADRIFRKSPESGKAEKMTVRF